MVEVEARPWYLGSSVLGFVEAFDGGEAQSAVVQLAAVVLWSLVAIFPDL